MIALTATRAWSCYSVQLVAPTYKQQETKANECYTCPCKQVAALLRLLVVMYNLKK